MSDFTNDFRADLGDLLYGMAKARGQYIDDYNQKKQNYLDKYSLITVVDDYNTIFYDVANSPGKGKYSPQEILQYIQTFQPIASIGQDHPHNEEVAQEYWQKLQSHRFSPLSKDIQTPKVRPGGFTDSTLLPSQSGMGGDGVKTWKGEGYDVEALNRSFRSIRRACKFGVGFVAEKLCQKKPQAKIRFLLDRFRMDNCFDKNFTIPGGWLGNQEFPITYSELRYAFRNWPKFKDNVVFYVNYQRVNPPWEEDWVLQDCFAMEQKALKPKWDEYKKYVAEKHKDDGKYTD